MTNEQTIGAIMDCVYEAYKVSRYRSIAGHSKFTAANDTVISAITAALAAKDAEIAALKQRLADSGRDLQALKADPAPGEWVEWNGGDCPIADGVRHQVKFRDGSLSQICQDAPSWSWRNDGSEFDIIAYRVLA